MGTTLKKGSIVLGSGRPQADDIVVCQWQTQGLHRLLESMADSQTDLTQLQAADPHVPLSPDRLAVSCSKEWVDPYSHTDQSLSKIYKIFYVTDGSLDSQTRDGGSDLKDPQHTLDYINCSNATDGM